ncbi:hypothetical protein niasHT_009054 [Heterodera trifolii]|uniref:Uncharacterized protein n=1 Tax=Heterodera trifolii TaxID=157864 RepID=A0ABD2MAH6_9BILA
MAINICDKKALVNQILAQADITVTTSGITELRAVAAHVKATEVEVDTMVTIRGDNIVVSAGSSTVPIRPILMPFIDLCRATASFRVKEQGQGCFNVTLRGSRTNGRCHADGAALEEGQKLGNQMYSENLLLAESLDNKRKIKVARLSAQYLVLMRAPNSLLSIRNIGVQLFPRQLDFFLDAYRKATARPYGYLLIDMHAASDPSLRLRTNIFKDEQQGEDEGTVVFIPKNGAA